MTDLEFMHEALAESQQAALEGEVPVGAIAVKNGVIIARAHNTVERDHDASCHAEISLLRECACIIGDWRLDEITLYVTKEPCPMCAGLMVNSHLKKVVFGMRDPRGGACGSGVLNVANSSALLWQVEVNGGVLEEECMQLFREFFTKVRRKSKETKSEA